MEEARQHSSLERAYFALGLMHIGGLLAFLLGLVLQFAVGNPALKVGLLTYVVSRLAIGACVFFRPELKGSAERSQARTFLGFALWVGAAFFVIFLVRSIP